MGISRVGIAAGRASLGTWLGALGGAMVGVLLVVAIAAPLLAPYDPRAQVAPPFARPSWAHPLGANDIGQDLLSELLVGARISLLVGILAALVATIVGTTVGLIAGFFRGPVDAVLMRVTDVVLVLPFLPLMIVIGVFLGPGLATQVTVIGAVSWAHAARELRAQVLSARERGHVQAARTMGAGSAYVLTRHVLPGVLPLLIPQFVRAVTAAILLEASLSFLGLGDPLAKSWGTILFYANARSAFLTDAWLWWVLPPGVAIATTVLAFAFLGYALEERIRPRLGTLATATPGRAPRASASLADARASADRLLLEVEDLTVEYATPRGPVRAVDGVRFALQRGQVLGVVGESGSGKTTLAAAVLGLVKPPGRVVGGRAFLAGRDLMAMGPDELRGIRGARVALIPQAAMNALNPVFTVLDQLAEAITAHRPGDRVAARARAGTLLELVGIPPERGHDYPHELSGGMRQRVVIAMALANDPWLVIADEPTTGLDVLVQADILALLKTLQTRLGLALLFISHDLGVVLHVADHLAVMQGGKIVEHGPAAEVASRPVHPSTRRLLAANPRPRPAVQPGNGSAVHSAPLLQLEAVSKSFPVRGRAGGRRLALDGVSLSIAPGEVVGVIGGSGAGKSTIARLVAGLARPDGGRIRFDGVDLAGLSGSARRTVLRRLHLVFQDPYDALPPHLRVREIVAEPLVIQRAERRDERTRQTYAALEEVGLTPLPAFLERYPHQLSGGERQRVALARALVLRPRLILADEPTSMLDVPLRGELLSLMRRLRDQHALAYLYITHDLALASGFCDRLIVLHQGRIVEEGATADVITRPRHAYTAALMRAVEALAPDAAWPLSPDSSSARAATPPRPPGPRARSAGPRCP